MIDCREYALKLITIKDRTKKEIIEKLKQKGYDENTISQQISFLEEYGYINDVNYAQKFINDCISIKKWGNRRIYTELVRKGIAKEIIESLLIENDNENEEEILLSEFKKRFSNSDLSNMKERRRIFAYFLRRGFKSSSIQYILNKNSSFEDCFYDDSV